ncbi:MAG: amino acid adenylation domain-containing protein [Acidobacteriota bacterium]|nr:amino acid adenylation domain-containing protein [Acidobacteriota bacterium]
MIDQLVATLKARDIRLSSNGGKLVIDAPRGSLTPELRQELATHRDQLLQHVLAPPASIPVRPRTGQGFPLSHAQARLWLLDRLEGGSRRYNLVTATRLRMAIDPVAFECALAEVVRRHEVLRTRFVLAGGEPLQLPLADAPIAFEIVDQQDVPEADRLAEAARACHAESRVSFDLSAAPPVRVRLLRFADDDHVLVLNLHHIVTDARSLDIFARDFERAYAGEALPPLVVQYADYAAWQRSAVAGARLQDGIDFWTKELAGLPELLPLPTDYPRPATQTYRGGAVPVHVPPQLVTALQQLARSAGASLFMAVEAVLAVVLARQSGSRDIAIGAPVTNRPYPELEPLIGFFANTVVLRCRIGEGQAFRDLLKQTKETTLAAFAHQDTPFEKLVETLHVRRDLSYSPIFQVMLSYLNRESSGSSASGSERLSLPQQDALSDLDWQLRDTAEGLNGFLMYAADLFSPETAERLVARFVRAIESVCANPDALVDAIDVIPADERRQMIEGWNQTAAAYPRNRAVHTLVEEQAARTPDAVAVTGAGESWSYRTLNQRANAVAVDLAAGGVGKGARVGLKVERTPGMLAALLGILKTGASYVPLDPGFPAERLAFMAADAGLALTLTDTELAAFEGRLAVDGPAVPVSGDDVMYTIYTSGSTGQPKGVMIPHRAVVNFLKSMARQPGLRASDSLLAVTTLSFDIAVLELFLPLTVGARVVLAQRPDVADPQRLMALLEREAITVMQATPAMWRMLLAAGWKGRDALTILCGGEALPRDLAHELRPRCAALWNMYGPTETTVWSAVREVPPFLNGDSVVGVEPIGRPIANTQLYVTSATGALLPAGAVGELCIGGDGVALGYLNQPALTGERFAANPFVTSAGARMYRTGDRARWQPDGTVEFLGRLDHQVKLRGFRIEPGEIESVLGRHPEVAHCAVMVRGAGPEAALVAYYVGGNVSADSLRELLRVSVPDYMVPSAFVRLERMPLTPNGKADRTQLPDVDRPAAPVGEAPAGDTERAIAELWEAVLPVRGPARDANFFDLGGHSLLIVHLHQRLVESLGATCDTLDLFRYPTIRQQAALLDGAAARRDVRAEAGAQGQRQQQALMRQRAMAAGRQR